MPGLGGEVLAMGPQNAHGNSQHWSSAGCRILLFPFSSPPAFFLLFFQLSQENTPSNPPSIEASAPAPRVSPPPGKASPSAPAPNKIFTPSYPAIDFMENRSAAGIH